MDSALPPTALGQDIPLVLLAIVVAIGTSAVTLTLFAHVLARGARSQGWLLLNGFCAGTGLWAASLIMALSEGAPAEGLAAGHVLLAFLLAISLTSAGLFLAGRPGRPAIAGGGAVIGLALLSAHMANMTALHPETLFWNKPLLVLGLLLGTGFFAAALAAFREWAGLRALAAGAGVMTIGAVAVFLALSQAADVAAYLAAAKPLPGDKISLAGLAGIGAAVVLITASIAAWIDGRAIQANFSRLGELIDGIPDGVVIAHDGMIIGVNLGLVGLSGRKERDLIGITVFGDLLATWKRQGPPGRSVAFETLMLTDGPESIPVRVVCHELHALGRANEVYSIRDIRDREEAKARIAMLSHDLTHTEADLRQRNFLLEVVLKNMTQGMAMYDKDQRVVIANDRYAEIYAMAPEDIRPGMKLREILQKRIDTGIYALGSPKAYLDARLAPVEEESETTFQLSDGRMIAISERPMPGGGWVTVHEDVTELRRITAENVHLAQHDALTLLPNRTSLREMLKAMLVDAGRNHRRLAMLMINLDHFREVNDSLGHQAGDTLLAAVAERLGAFRRRTTLLGRLGDDEFVLIDAVERPGRDAAALAARIQDNIRKPFNVNGKMVNIGATIGIAISPGDGQDADLLLKRADLALYRAKRQQRGTYQFFEPSMERQLAEELNLQADLTAALTRGEFELHYQPLVNLARKEVSGFETLLRWNHPARGQLSPADFLPAAEAAGLMPAIGEWALRQACREAAQWPEPLKVALNVSNSQFKAPDFVQSVIGALAAAGLSAQRLEIEMSETVIWEDREEAFAITRRLSDLGVVIALDDFGTGFASFTSLREFPFKRVKIDRSLLGAIDGKAESQAMVRTLLRLGAGFGAAITAEGVETKEQYEFVLQEGFTEMQGFYFSPPKTAGEIRRLFLSEKDSAVA